MNVPKPTITINVDVTNPGQFFACCGLLELADRLWPGAEGWFHGSTFCVNCGGTLDVLLTKFTSAELHSSLTSDELRRLASLLSKEKATLTPGDSIEKKRLQQLWKMERLWLSEPFGLWLDWWRDEHGERTALKTWAAKQLVAEMAGRMFEVCREAFSRDANPSSQLFFASNDDSLPFYFDSDMCSTGAARDAGFSTDALGIKSAYRPLVELLTFVAFQRFQPMQISGGFTYCSWRAALPPSVAAPVASGTIPYPGQSRYSFSLLNRTKYMKAFLPAKSIKGD